MQHRKLSQKIKHPLLILCGYFFLALSFIGVFVPVMPTVPFVIVAAYCFSRSSQRLHHWLQKQPHLGPALCDWEINRVIRRRSKWIATAAVTFSVAGTLVFTNVPWIAKLAMVITVSAVLIYIWMQKSEAT